MMSCQRRGGEMQGGARDMRVDNVPLGTGQRRRTVGEGQGVDGVPKPCIPWSAC